MTPPFLHTGIELGSVVCFSRTQCERDAFLETEYKNRQYIRTNILLLIFIAFIFLTTLLGKHVDCKSVLKIIIHARENGVYHALLGILRHLL